MESKNHDYSLYIKFFETFSQASTQVNNTDDPLMTEIDQLTKINSQLFYISDAILLDILFISKSVNNLFGVEPERVTQGFFLTTTHPDDLKRHHLARAKLINLAQELYIQKKGERIMSTNVRARKSDGNYFNALYQAFLFYSKFPYESVFLILVITDISDLKRVQKGFHHYCGDDRRCFRYPDNELLMKGNIFSHTEFKILELIDEGLSSNEIAAKIFRSSFTINTHRTNILKKSGKHSITEVLKDLKAQGLL